MVRDGIAPIELIKRMKAFYMFSAAKRRARLENIPFDIEESDVIVPDNCPVTGKPLQWNAEGRWRDDSPSLDKLIPSLGYTKGNVWVISWRANCLKKDATLEEIDQLSRYVRERLTKVA